MKIKKVRIRNFRSINDITLELDDLGVLCGPNSCGKSNLFRAITFAFKKGESISRDDIYNNMISSKRGTVGGPRLSIWVNIHFEDYPDELSEYAQNDNSREIEYQFRAIRNGTVSRALELRVQ